MDKGSQTLDAHSPGEDKKPLLLLRCGGGGGGGVGAAAAGTSSSPLGPRLSVTERLQPFAHSILRSSGLPDCVGEDTASLLASPSRLISCLAVLRGREKREGGFSLRKNPELVLTSQHLHAYDM